MDNTSTGNQKDLIYKIGDLVIFRPYSQMHDEDKDKVWLVKDFVNKTPEEFSVFDYVLTDATHEIVAIEYEIERLEVKK